MFLVRTLVTFAERAEVGFWEDRGGLSVRLDHVKKEFLVEMVLKIFEEVDPSLPQAERREAVRERVKFFSWSLITSFFVTVIKLDILLKE